MEGSREKSADPFASLQVSFLQLALSQIGRFWPWYCFGLAFLFATHTIQSQLPFLVKEMADTVGQDSSAGVDKMDFLGIAIGIIIFRSLSRILIFYPARVREKRLRVEILRILESVSPTRYSKYDNGQIFQLLGKDVEEIRSFLGFVFLQVGNISVALVVLVPKLMLFDTRLIWGLMPLLLVFIVFSAVVGRNHRYYKQMQDRQGEIQNFIMESYGGKKTIQNFHVEDSFMNLFGRYSASDLKLFFKAGLRTAFSMPLIPFGAGMSLVWGAFIVYHYNLEPTAFLLYSGIAFLFLEPLSYLFLDQRGTDEVLRELESLAGFFKVFGKTFSHRRELQNLQFSGGRSTRL